jgi:protein-disulfide isomerase
MLPGHRAPEGRDPRARCGSGPGLGAPPGGATRAAGRHPDATSWTEEESVKSGNAIIVAATILGLSLIGGAYLLVRSIDGAAGQLGALSRAVSQMELAGAPEPERRPDRPRRRGPDPDRAYDVSTEGSPAKGPADAKVTLVEFSDFQCPFCGRVTPTLRQIREKYGDDVRIVFKHLPLRMHPKAPQAHAAAEAAKLQGRFWEMHDRIFANQREMSEEKYLEYAKEIGLDVERFKRDMASAEVKQRIDADVAEAAKLGVTGTPGFFINGYFLSGAKPYAEFERLIDAQLAEG